MEDSILKSIKKTVGIDASYDVFDLDIIMWINNAFATLTDLGIGPGDGFSIDDDSAKWADFIGTDKRLNSVQSYVYLRVRKLFDPPTTGYLVDAMDKQIAETEWRLNVIRENDVHPMVVRTDDIDDGELVVDGGQM